MNVSTLAVTCAVTRMLTCMRTDVLDMDQLSQLPAPLRADVTVHMLSAVLGGEVGHLFVSLSAAERSFLAMHARPQLVRVGEALCQEGDPADSLFFLYEGTMCCACDLPCSDCMHAAICVDHALTMS